MLKDLLYNKDMKQVLLAAILLMAIIPATAQGPFELTTKIQKMDSREFEVLNANAASGDTDAQFLLGVGYTVGFRQMNIKANGRKAEEWLTKPGLKNNADATFWLLYPSLRMIEVKLLRPKLEQLAEGGSLGAMNLLADFAVEGAGGPKDYAEAMKWWREAADKDSAEGQFNLGLMYLGGEGVPADGNEGVRWLRKSADKGFPPAAARIAPMAMMKQYGLEPNEDVRKWLLTAAERGDAVSMLNLGMAYFHEIGGSADYVEAYKWFTLAVRFGAKQNVIDGRPGLKPKMTREQIAEAEKRAKQWELHPLRKMLMISAPE